MIEGEKGDKVNYKRYKLLRFRTKIPPVTEEDKVVMLSFLLGSVFLVIGSLSLSLSLSHTNIHAHSQWPTRTDTLFFWSKFVIFHWYGGEEIAENMLPRELSLETAMVVEVSEIKKKKKKYTYFFCSPRKHRHFFWFCHLLLPIHVLVCHVEGGDGVCYHVCSFMGWIDVICTVFLQVFLFMITLEPNQLSLSLSRNWYSDAFSFTMVAVLRAVVLQCLQKYCSPIGLRIQFNLWFKCENFLWWFQKNSQMGKTYISWVLH